MEHLDPDHLVLLALNERVEQSDVRALSTLDASSTAHLQECALCRGELDGLTRTVDLARSAADLGPMGQPALPASIWTGIASELGIGADSDRAGSGVPSDRPATDVPVQRSPVVMMDDPPVRAPGLERRPARRTDASRPPQHRRMPSVRRALLVAGVVIAVALGTVAGFAIGQRSEGQIAAVEYQAELKPMPSGPTDAHATATVTQTDGSQTLRVSARQLPLRQGYYEVWLYNPTADKMVAVGTLGAAGDGVFTLASTIDLRSYSVVDVSAQDFDGNPAHKDSMLQGRLTQ